MAMTEKTGRVKPPPTGIPGDGVPSSDSVHPPSRLEVLVFRPLVNLTPQTLRMHALQNRCTNLMKSRDRWEGFAVGLAIGWAATLLYNFLRWLV